MIPGTDILREIYELEELQKQSHKATVELCKVTIMLEDNIKRLKKELNKELRAKER